MFKFTAPRRVAFQIAVGVIALGPVQQAFTQVSVQDYQLADSGLLCRAPTSLVDTASSERDVVNTFIYHVDQDGQLRQYRLIVSAGQNREQLALDLAGMNVLKSCSLPAGSAPKPGRYQVNFIWRTPAEASPQ